MEKKINEREMKGLKDHVPERGSLGLLALGAVGIKAWRDKRKKQPDPEK